MLQTLFYIPRNVFGAPLFGFGILLAVWGVAAVAILVYQARGQGLNRDTLGYVPLLALMGAMIAFIMPRIGDEQGIPIRGYGTVVLLALVIAGCMTAWRAKQVGLNPDVAISLLVWLFIPGVIGARLFYVIQFWNEYRADTWTQTLINTMKVSEGGLVVYGSVIGSAIGLIAFVRYFRLPGLAVADLVAPACAVAMGLGRIGCFLNGCCFGGPCDLPWAVSFPFGSPPYVRQVEEGKLYIHGIRLADDATGPAVIDAVEPGSDAAKAGLSAGQQIEAINRHDVKSTGQALAVLLNARKAGDRVSITTSGSSQPVTWKLTAPPTGSLRVHPTQLYSAIDGVLLGAFLFALYPYRRRDGTIFATYLTIYPISRFLQEVIRTDEHAVLNTGMSIAQNVSLVILLVAAALWAIVWTRSKGLAFPIGNPTIRPAPQG